MQLSSCFHCWACRRRLYCKTQLNVNWPPTLRELSRFTLLQLHILAVHRPHSSRMEVCSSVCYTLEMLKDLPKPYTVLTRNLHCVCCVTESPRDSGADLLTAAHWGRCDIPSMLGTVTTGHRWHVSLMQLTWAKKRSGEHTKPPHPVHFKKSRHMQYLRP